MRLHDILPPEAVSGASRIVLNGQEQLLIEGHKGLMRYDAGCVSLRMQDGSLHINGENLMLGIFSQDELTVHGRILSLEFQP